MREVTLNKQDTCFTYVIRRRGLEAYLNIDDAKLYNLSIEKHLDTYFKKHEYNYNHIQVGDILMWDNANTQFLPMKIGGNCILYSFIFAISEPINQFNLPFVKEIVHPALIHFVS